ncbi:site-2 protease family protein [Orenia marismortui]|uniref:Zn-dependent protease n=1 Tax=Orenia marismortui TaxID=46469 RepID=A0A4R8GRQ6_9FIRM|nr:site-2 protease family protein [Orenia marismortui]TDX45201.1 Zn-dependent protease [Orenia marismortui]
MNKIAELALLIPILLLSLSMHEFAHGKMADLLGDPTPKMTGRLTLNPMAHLSLMGTLVLLITRRFGWAKPVQVNPRYFKDQRKGMMLVGLAGPLANILLAIVFALIFKFAAGYLFQIANPYIIRYLFLIAISINLGLAIFNLIPVPPLDGSKILEGILPASMDHIIRNLEAYGPFFLLFFAFSGFLGSILGPIIMIVRNLLFNIVGI